MLRKVDHRVEPSLSQRSSLYNTFFFKLVFQSFRHQFVVVRRQWSVYRMRTYMWATGSLRRMLFIIELG